MIEDIIMGLSFSRTGNPLFSLNQCKQLMPTPSSGVVIEGSGGDIRQMTAFERQDLSSVQKLLWRFPQVSRSDKQ